MEDKSIEQLRDDYYSAINLLSNEQDILDALPSPDFVSFFPLMEGLIGRLNNEIIQLQENLNTEIDLDMIEYIKEEISICKIKVDACKKKFELTLRDIKIEDESFFTKKHLIFASTDMGNVYFESDLKYIPSEYYDSVLECLNSLESGIEESNEEKAKSMANNAKLLGIHEVKKFKIRVYYQVLAPDCAYVILTRQKKQDNSKLDREIPIKRKNNTNAQYLFLKKLMTDPIQRQNIISENEEIRNRILDSLNKGKRKK